MSTFFIALFVAIGGGAWAYAKVHRMTGGNKQTSSLMGAVAGVILFLFIYIVFSFVPE